MENTIGGGVTPSRVFEERKLELQASKNRWRNLFVLNIFLLVFIMPASLAALVSGVGFGETLWLGFGLGLPLAYSAVFFHAQHNREREFLEEYSFKSVVARSLDGYRLLFKEVVDPARGEDQKKFLDFLMDSVRELHMPPRAIISKHPLKSEEDVKIGVVEKLADVFKKFIP